MNIVSISVGCIALTMSMVGITYAENWTGFYAGVNAGFIFNYVQLQSNQPGFTNPSGQCNHNSHFSALSPGMQLGYLHQFPNSFAAGIEADFSTNSIQSATLRCSCPYTPGVSDRFSFKNQMQRSIKGRAGRALNWNNSMILPYLTAGASFAKTGLTYSNEGNDYYSTSNTKAGWLIGAGIEWPFRKNWSLRAEYSYTGYGNAGKLNLPSVYGLLDSYGSARSDLNTNSLMVAINYWI